MGTLRRIIQVAALIAAVGLIIAGVLDNGAREVWSEAVMVCMECVGIG